MMIASKAISRANKIRCLCNNFLLSSSSLQSFQTQRLLPALLSDQLSRHLYLVNNGPIKSSLYHHLSHDLRVLNWRQFSTASTESSEKGEENANATNNPESGGPPRGENQSEVSKESGSGAESEPKTPKRTRKNAKRTAFSDSESDEDRSVDDLVKLLDEREEQLKTKHKEIEAMQDKVLRAYAEMENVMDRTKREADNSKKFAIQGFAKSLLDVADNLGRASSHVKENFSKVDSNNDSAVPLLKTLLEGVEMTEKQLLEVFKKFGVEKYDPIGEPFDPHRHNAVFQLNDSSKPPGTVGAVLKVGYTLYDRVIRHAEVGVTNGPDDDNSTA